jgi:hypothetical protein
MKAILTKYLGATNTKPGRVKAYDCDNNSITIPYDHELIQGMAHKKAAEALCYKMKWTGKLVGGGIKGGYAFCFKDSWI